MHDLLVIFLRFGGAAILGCLAVQCLIVISMAHDGYLEANPFTRSDVAWFIGWLVAGLTMVAVSF